MTTTMARKQGGTVAAAAKSSVGRVMVCFAVSEEAKFFNAGVARVLVTGMGRANAERALRQSLDGENYGLVLTCGFAGGLNPNFKTGMVVFSNDEDAGLSPVLLRAGACPGRFFNSERVAVTAAEKRALWEKSAADAVEMESAVIRDVCRSRGIPSATIRVISDAADETLPLDFNALMTGDQRLHYGRLMLGLLRRPGAIPALMQLQRQARMAAQKLAAVLTQVIPR